jgi:WD40 repeat protein
MAHDAEVGLATASSSSVWLWDARTGRPWTTFPGLDAFGLVATANGEHLAVRGLGQIHIVDLKAKRREPRTLDCGDHIAEETVSIAAFSKNGRLLAVASSGRAEIRIWDTESWESVGTLTCRYGWPIKLFNLTFSPDGLWLAGRWSGGPGHGNGVVWNVRSRRQVAELTTHKRWISGLAFSPDSKCLASTSLDGSVRLWVRPKWRCRSVLKTTLVEGETRSPAFSEDGRWLAVHQLSDESQVTTLWDIRGRSVSKVIRGCGDNSAIANLHTGHGFSATTTRLDTFVWRSECGTLTAVFPGQCAAASRDGQNWAAIDGNNVNLYRIQTLDNAGALRSTNPRQTESNLSPVISVDATDVIDFARLLTALRVVPK